MSVELFDFQKNHLDNIHKIIKVWGNALDSSATGTGKTFTSVALSKKLNITTVIIAPKILLPNWEKTTDLFNNQNNTLIISNYEQFALEKTPFYQHGRWNLPEETLIIWDEAHYLKTWSSKRSLMARKALRWNNLYLSATIAEAPTHLHTIGRGVKLFHSFSDFIKSCGCYQNIHGNIHKNLCHGRKKYGECACGGVATVLNEMQTVLYHPQFPRAHRMKREDIRGLPQLQLYTQSVSIHTDKANKIYKKLTPQTTRKELVEARIEMETMKIPWMAERVQLALQNGQSTIVFLSFKLPLLLLAKALLEKKIPVGIISGAISDERQKVVLDEIACSNFTQDSEKTIEKFQKNKLKVVISTLKAGGTGLSLDDTEGSYPRLAIINPDWQAMNLVQALGRINRANSKSVATAEILYAEGTLEEVIANTIERKRGVIDTLNDADVSPLALL